MFSLPFDRPFDRLTVLSKVDGLMVLSMVEGLTALSKVEGRLCGEMSVPPRRGGGENA